MAKPIPSLPNEIFDKIFSFSTKKELLQARLVSHNFCAICTVYLFKYLTIEVKANKKAKSVRALHGILATKYLAHSIRGLEVNGPGVCQPQRRGFRAWLRMLKPLRPVKHLPSKLTDTMRDSLDDLRKLERLCALTIRFCEESCRHTGCGIPKLIAFRSDMLGSVFTPLLSRRSLETHLEYLCISRLQSRSEPTLTNSAGFVDLLRNLHTLGLSIQTPELYLLPPWHKGVLWKPSLNFYNMMPDKWLLPASQNLKHLHLGADLPWGWYPKVDFRHIRFPHLECLTLGLFTFSHDWQLEWLQSHAESLRSLRLHHCSMLAFADTTLRRLDSDGYPVSGYPVSVYHGTIASGRTHRCFEGQWCCFFRAFTGTPSGLRLRNFIYTDFSQWRPPRGIVHAACDEELVELRHKFCYSAYTLKDHFTLFNSRFNYTGEDSTPEDKVALELLQLREDEKAYLELMNTIEERNTARS